MFYIFCGSDRKEVVKKFRAAIAAFKNKNPQGDIFRFEATDFSSAAVDELIVGRGLFGQKILVAGTDVFTDAATRDELAERLLLVAESPNAFLFLEDYLPQDFLKKLEKMNGRVFVFTDKNDSLLPQPFNIFRLTDALGERDRQKLWLLYTEALNSGLAPEEIFWRLVWQAKVLLLVQKSGNAPLSSLKPFVELKANRFIKNFKEEELITLSGAFLSLWHDSRKGRGDLAIGLERLLLTV